jgi:heme exporter protein A
MNFPEIEFEAENISKSFKPGKFIFRSVNIHAKSGTITGIAGRNGSGKSTMLQIAAGVIKPTKGEIILKAGGENIRKDSFPEYFGYISPYLVLYEEFTPREHARFYCNFKGIEYSPERFGSLMKRFDIDKFADSPIGTFSSGMKQRMKFVNALMHQTPMLFLDEPGSYLDNDGFESVINFVTEYRDSGGTVILASNDDREKSICNYIVDLNS